MKSNYFILEIIFLLISSFIPWPGPTVFKISCPKQDARIVRKIIQNKWIPILEKYKVKIPLECPFHPSRDIFGPQEAAKHQHRHSQWTCGLCGKSFFEEKYLDMHFDNRHKGHINMAEDAVCLADFCDIMRCDVLRSQDIRTGYSEPVNTDIEIWRESTAYKTELTTSGPRDVAKYVTKSTDPSNLKTSTVKNLKKPHCQNKEIIQDNNDESNSNENEKQQNNSSNNICPNDLVDSALPATDNKQQRIIELQKLKANCKPEELQKLKNKCEIFVRDCIASLLIQLSVKDFKEVEGNKIKKKNVIILDMVGTIFVEPEFPERRKPISSILGMQGSAATRYLQEVACLKMFLVISFLENISETIEWICSKFS